MDKTLYSEEVLQRFKDCGYEHYVLPWENRSMSRPQAMEKLQPLIDQLDQGMKTADFVAEVEAAFTYNSVKALPPNDKRTIRLPAEAAGNDKVLNWIREAKQDQEKSTWKVRAETPRPPADAARIMFRDLARYIEAGEVHTRSHLRRPVQMINTLFELIEQGSSDNQKALESNDATTPSQLKEQAVSTLDPLEQQQSKKRISRGYRRS